MNTGLCSVSPEPGSAAGFSSGLLNPEETKDAVFLTVRLETDIK